MVVSCTAASVYDTGTEYLFPLPFRKSSVVWPLSISKQIWRQLRNFSSTTHMFTLDNPVMYVAQIVGCTGYRDVYHRAEHAESATKQTETRQADSSNGKQSQRICQPSLNKSHCSRKQAWIYCYRRATSKSISKKCLMKTNTETVCIQWNVLHTSLYFRVYVSSDQELHNTLLGIAAFHLRKRPATWDARVLCLFQTDVAPDFASER